MPKEIVVAIIAGITALLGGAFAWIQANKTSKLKAQADVVLEEMRAEGERKRKAFELASAEARPVELALSQAWQDIQTIKEVISKVLSPIRYDEDVARSVFRPAVNNLVDGYGKWGTEIPDSAKAAWHNAKNAVIAIELTLFSQPNNQAPFTDADLTPEIAESLKEARLSLTDFQMILAAARQTVREQVAAKILKAL